LIWPHRVALRMAGRGDTPSGFPAGIGGALASGARARSVRAAAGVSKPAGALGAPPAARVAGSWGIPAGFGRFASGIRAARQGRSAKPARQTLG
jgi:hypothetical protein